MGGEDIHVYIVKFNYILVCNSRHVAKGERNVFYIKSELVFTLDKGLYAVIYISYIS